MTDHVAHLADLRFHFAKVARHGEFGEMKPLLFQKLPRRSLVELARDHDVRPEHQDVFRAARQNPKPAGIIGREGFKSFARITAETEDLLGIGQRDQQLPEA